MPGAERERFVDVEDRRERLRHDADRLHRALGKLAIGRRHERHGLFGMEEDVRDERRLILDDQRHDVAARNVGGGRDDDIAPRECGVLLETHETTVRFRGADGGAEPDALARQIVHVEGRAEELLLTFAADDALPDRLHRHDRAPGPRASTSTWCASVRRAA